MLQQYDQYIFKHRNPVITTGANINISFGVFHKQRCGKRIERYNLYVIVGTQQAIAQVT